MIQFIGKLLFTGWGWKMTGSIPYHIPKKLYVVLPHTSNWDFFVGIFIKMYKKMEVGYIAKDSLFKWPFGWFFRMTGGIPVNRSKSEGFIDSVVRACESRKRFSMSIAPEGTRKKVTQLKSGFYYIAKQANIPVIYTKFDWKNRTVDFAPPRYVATTYEAEIAILNEHFKDVIGKIPKNGYLYNA